MKKQAFNPYLPSWEYIPDGEPYVFGDRVYVYGSHDQFDGHVYCINDYVCWSAPVDDLSDWRYEGIIYPRNEDPLNKDGAMCLYAPDVTVGPDGKYYLFYVLDHVDIVSVAVCDTPAGRYQFHGHVHYPDGTLLGAREGDEPQFDPGVLTEGDKTYLYTGFCGEGDKSRHGAMVTVLYKDMLTILEEPRIIVPGSEYSKGTEYENHAYFEAASIRKIGDTYYFVYSSEVMHELCYATSKSPVEGFSYGGVLISNCDMHIDSYKPAQMRTALAGNNHGSFVNIKGEYYLFYHRHTNGHEFSRQDCAEKITVNPDGSIPQVELTSCGLNGGPLKGRGAYPAYIACNLFVMGKDVRNGDSDAPMITQDGVDGDEYEGYVANIYDGATMGFKYFDFKGVSKITITTRAYLWGEFEIRTRWDGEVLASIPVDNTNVWVKRSAPISIPDGVGALYITFRGYGRAGQFKSFELE